MDLWERVKRGNRQLYYFITITVARRGGLRGRFLVEKVLRIVMFQVDRGILICEGAGGLIRRRRECGGGGGELRGYKANWKFWAQRSQHTSV